MKESVLFSTYILKINSKIVCLDFFILFSGLFFLVGSIFFFDKSIRLVQTGLMAGQQFLKEEETFEDSKI